MNYLLLCVLALATLHPTDLICQVNPSRDNRITTVGIGEMEVPADRAVVKFTASGFGPTLPEAVGAARTIINGLTAELRLIGIQDSNLVTAYFTSGENKGGKPFLSSKRDYVAAIEMRVTIDSLELLEAAITALSRGNIDRLSDIAFSLRDDVSIKMRVRQMAVQNAMIKADLMAMELGCRVGQAIEVEELLSTNDGDFYAPRGVEDVLKLSAGMVRNPGGAVFFPQRFRIRGGVRVTFELSRDSTMK